jgi:hypothetical protein
MSDLPPDLPRLRTLETYLALQLDQVRARIREQEEAARAAGQAPRGAADSDQESGDAGADDGVAWWKLVPGRPAVLHRGDCPSAGSGPTITRSVARTALKDRVDGKPTATACTRCHPELGL